MTDDRDELIVRKFFEENKIDVPDDGFSRRVMRRLPDRERRLSRVWTAVCAVLGVLLVVKNDWLGVVWAQVQGLFDKASELPLMSGSHVVMFLSVLIVISLWGYKAISED